MVAIARVRTEQPGEAVRLEFHPDPFQRRRRRRWPAAADRSEFRAQRVRHGRGGRPPRAGAHRLPRARRGQRLLRDDLRAEGLSGVGQGGRPAERPGGAEPGGRRGRPRPTSSRSSSATAPRCARGRSSLALGNPYAIARDGQASAGWGIVANLARKAPPAPEDSEAAGKRTLHHFGTLIQTDAKLNLGTSGGPLLNLRGEMVGLCVALAATAGYETSAGYAIPVDATFRRVLEVLKQGREVEYGFLGIQPANLQPQEVLAGLHGTRVDSVVRGTPAARYGLRDGRHHHRRSTARRSTTPTPCTWRWASCPSRASPA